VVIKTSQTAFSSGSRRAARENPTAIWPWIVMPLVVLLVFCILHYDVRPLGHGAGTSAAQEARGSASSIPTE
jgi:H+/Cl- antiporter ClcA